MNFLTTAQVAKILGVTQRRVQAMVTAGQIKASRAGRTWVIDPAEVEKVKHRKNGRPPKKD
jgi:excisionase family DNA binding protein